MNGLERGCKAGIRERLRARLEGKVALLGSRDGAGGVRPAVHGIFGRRRFGEVAARTSRLVAGL